MSNLNFYQLSPVVVGHGFLIDEEDFLDNLDFIPYINNMVLPYKEIQTFFIPKGNISDSRVKIENLVLNELSDLLFNKTLGASL